MNNKICLYCSEKLGCFSYVGLFCNEHCYDMFKIVSDIKVNTIKNSKNEFPEDTQLAKKENKNLIFDYRIYIRYNNV